MNEMITLANIERRISFHMQGAYANILEVGRCLIEAKEANVVPHGQWEAWVQRTAGMSERTAQRLMQAAREVSPESAMAKLPISKITAILALPEPQREAVAVKAVEENQSLRELQATIDEMREELHQTRRQVTKANLERDNAIAVLDKAQKRRAAFESECNELRRQVQGIKEAPATGISKEAQARIDSLTKQKEALAAQLADAEQMAEYQARQREQAQAELLDLRTQTARGELPIQEDLTAEAVGMAARTFMGAVGYVPHSDKLVTMREGDRQQIATYAAMLQHWAEEVLNAVSSARDTVIIEGV